MDLPFALQFGVTHQRSPYLVDHQPGQQQHPQQ